MSASQANPALAADLEERSSSLDALAGRIAQTPRGLAHVLAIEACHEQGRLVFHNVAEIEAMLPMAELYLRFGHVLTEGGIDVSSEQCDELARAAWLSKDAWDFVTQVCGELLRQSRPFSPALQHVAAYHLSFGPPPDLEKRGQKAHTHTARNGWVRLVAKELERSFNLQKSANPTSSATSICQLIVEVLGSYAGASLTEAAVIKILDAPEDPFAVMGALKRRASESIDGLIVSDD